LRKAPSGKGNFAHTHYTKLHEGTKSKLFNFQTLALDGVNE